MKKITITFGILLLAGALAMPVFAHGPFGGGRGWSDGPGYCWRDNPSSSDMTDEQRAELGKLEEAFYNETGKLKREIWDKSDQIRAAMAVDSPDPGKVKAIQAEVSQLKAKMAEYRIDYELKARSIAPKSEFARGYGRPSSRCGSFRGGSSGWGPCGN
jgi:Spy/CpxP family protein refolding chaperone